MTQTIAEKHVVPSGGHSLKHLNSTTAVTSSLMNEGPLVSASSHSGTKCLKPARNRFTSVCDFTNFS